MAGSPIPLLVYGDESYDQPARNIYAVAGAVGSERDWRVTEEAWVAALRGEQFHAARFESEFADDPDKTKHPARQAHYAELATVLRDSPLLFCCVALDLTSYRTEIPNHLPRMPYLLCFNNLARMCTESVRLDGGPTTFEFTLDRQDENGATVSALYDLLFAGLGTNQLSGTLSFSTRANPRIAIADLMARETMKDAARLRGYHDRAMRRSFRAMTDAGRVRMRILDGSFAKKIQDEAGPILRAYAQWLRETGRVDHDGNPLDTEANRIAFGKVDWPERARE